MAEAYNWDKVWPTSRGSSSTSTGLLRPHIISSRFYNICGTSSSATAAAAAAFATYAPQRHGHKQGSSTSTSPAVNQTVP
jgi:hypothetical protein